ncbi:MAG: FG-GAP-like repeat-containing protein [Kiritimatiellia bacterium]
MTSLAGLGCDGTDENWLVRLGDPSFSWDFEVWNSQTGQDTSLRWEVSVPDHVPWLAVAPATGILGRNQTELVTVTCDPDGLSPGNYRAVLQVSGEDVATGQPAVNSPREFGVDLVVRPGDALDFGGVGRSALVIYGLNNGEWGLRDLYGDYVWDWLGDRDYLPVPGDYTGNGMADLAVYRPVSGNWYWKARDSANIYLLGSWGGPGFQPVSGDFDGDGRQDFALYNEASGAWYALLSGSGYSQPVTAQLGGSGNLAVNGDFDGDGLADPAVYHPASGRWQAFLSGLNYQWADGYFGGPGFTALTGDFNGDGRADLCVYHESGRWFILTVENRWLLSGAWWGGPGYQPIIGDFDGDGIDDLGVYETATGYWRIRAVSGTIMAWDLPWGGYGYAPVSR